MAKQIVSGIYKIVNLVNGKMYVGSSTNVMRRLRQHQMELSSGKHRNKRLLHAWNKYGIEAFALSVIEPVSMELGKNNLISREQFWIDQLAPEYNICVIAANARLGVKASDETKRLMSEQRKGREVKPEARVKISLALQGKPKSPEHVAKVVAANAGRELSAQARKNIAEARRKRALEQVVSDETKHKLSERSKGRKKSLEERMKISEGAKRREANRKLGLLPEIPKDPVTGRFMKAA